MPVTRLTRGWTHAGVNEQPVDALFVNDGVHANVIDWAKRVVTNGGAFPSRTSILAMDGFYRAVVAAGIDTKMKSCCVFVPDGIIAASTPIFKAYGNDPWTNTGASGFSSSSLTIMGLKGTGNDYFNTGVAPTTAFASDNTGGLSLYAIDDGPVFLGGPDIGVWDATSFNANNKNFGLYAVFSDNNCYWDCFGSGTGRISASNIANPGGYISGNRTASNATAIYHAHSRLAHATLTSGSGVPNATRPTKNVYCFGLNLNGTSYTASSIRLSMAAIHDGLTSSESSAFFDAIQACRKALGGGFV